MFAVLPRESGLLLFQEKRNSHIRTERRSDTGGISAPTQIQTVDIDFPINDPVLKQPAFRKQVSVVYDHIVTGKNRILG